jgi:molybdopterin synthase catalytic subunit
MTSVRARLLLEPFEPAEVLREFSALLGVETGAVVTFSGLARGQSKAGGTVAALVLEHHPRLTQRSLDEIAASAAERFDVTAIDVIHRAGTIAPGEAIVWVAAASAHRRAAFEAADYLMDRLKTDAMFWKREEAPDGSAWIEPTAADVADRARWE